MQNAVNRAPSYLIFDALGQPIRRLRAVDDHGLDMDPLRREVSGQVARPVTAGKIKKSDARRPSILNEREQVDRVAVRGEAENPASRAACAVCPPTATTGSASQRWSDGCIASARAALPLVMMMPSNKVGSNVASVTGSIVSTGAIRTSWPRVRNAAAVRSASIRGRVTSNRMS